jgi:hypothetical protein
MNNEKNAAPADWINDVVRDVAELPDRDSPPDAPDMMLVTGDELREIVERHAPVAHAQKEAAPAADTEEATQLLNGLIDSITEHGNYSPESTLIFLGQIKQCLAAPTTVPDHSERGAANAVGLPVDLIHDFRDAINIAHHRADHAGDTTRMKRWKDVSRRLEEYVRDHQSPATIAAGQEAANAKDAARYRFLRNQASQSEGFPPADGACWVVQYHHPRGTVPELTSAGYFDKLDRAIDAAMTTVGAGGSHVE